MYSGTGDNDFSAGIWSSTTGDVTVDNECDTAGDSDCISAQNAKCKTNKAFIILGILASATALAPIVKSDLPSILGPAAAGFAAFSYMIVMSIAAANYNGKPSVDSDCGNGYSDNDNVSYGAGFILLVVAFVLSFAGAGLSLMAGKAPVTPN